MTTPEKAKEALEYLQGALIEMDEACSIKDGLDKATSDKVQRIMSRMYRIIRQVEKEA